MATEDRSRSAFYPGKHYTGVRMQQGRVLTDDDYNEGSLIQEEEERLARLHVIGPAGSPGDGFKISGVKIRKIGRRRYFDFDIAAGTFYLGGLRLRMERPGQTFLSQTDWLRNPGMMAPTAECTDLVYLEAWRQPVSAVEDEELFEVALQGVDTTTRLCNMARVRVHRFGEITERCTQAWHMLVQSVADNNLGTWRRKTHELTVDASLTVAFEENGNSDEGNGNSEGLCSPSATPGYLGAENQAIRVQLVNRDYFTWGFDNGAPLYRVQLNNETIADGRTVTRVTMLSAPKDQAHRPVAGQVVQIIPWTAVLPNGEKLAHEIDIDNPLSLSRVETGYDDQTRQFTLFPAIPSNYGQEWYNRDDSDSLLTPRSPNGGPAEYMFMRVWDRGSDHESPPAIPLEPAPVKLGATGVQITIAGQQRRSGDYWIIAVRPETPDKVVPWELKTGRGPDGIRRFYAPLALIRWDDKLQPVVRDCRRVFKPLARPAIHVTGVYGIYTSKIPNEPRELVGLQNDDAVPLSKTINGSHYLFGGINIECDSDLSLDFKIGKPEKASRTTCIFSVDVPLSASQTAAGMSWPKYGAYQSIVLMGSVNLETENVISWRLAENSPIQSVLQNLVHVASSSGDSVFNGILARLTLKGNFIRAQHDPEVYLDGEVLGNSGATPGSIKWPSGNGKPGSDFEIWFWLTNSQSDDV